MSIHKKLLQFQQLNISVRKDKKNSHFKNDYASLNEVLDKVKEPLNKLNVVIIQNPTADGLHTELYDTESDTSVTSHTPFINPTDMQKLGGAITYARRYSLVALLGLEDDDDDGNTASAKPTQTAPQKPKIELPEAFKLLREATTVLQLETAYKTLPASLRLDPEVIAVASEHKNEIINAEPEIK